MTYCTLKEMLHDLQTLIGRVGEGAQVAFYCHCCDRLDTYDGATGAGPTKSAVTGELLNAAASVVIGINKD